MARQPLLTARILPSAPPPAASSRARADRTVSSSWCFGTPSAIVNAGRRFTVRIQTSIKRILFLFLTSCSLVMGEDGPAGPSYVDHARLMVYRDEQNGEHPVRTKDDWLRRRRHIVAGMERAMGPLPDGSKLPPLDVRVGEKFDGDGYTRLTISYVADEGDRVPAYLYLPARRPRDERR